MCLGIIFYIYVVDKNCNMFSVEYNKIVLVDFLVFMIYML